MRARLNMAALDEHERGWAEEEAGEWLRDLVMRREGTLSTKMFSDTKYFTHKQAPNIMQKSPLASEGEKSSEKHR